VANNQGPIPRVVGKGVGNVQLAGSDDFLGAWFHFPAATLAEFKRLCDGPTNDVVTSLVRDAVAMVAKVRDLPLATNLPAVERGVLRAARKLLDAVRVLLAQNRVEEAKVVGDVVNVFVGAVVELIAADQAKQL
jgi:hypothetical protein